MAIFITPGGGTGGIASDTTGITGADAIANIVSLTQAEYNAIVSPDPDTLYITSGAEGDTSFTAIPYAASVELDMAAYDGQYRTISLTGNLTFTTINRAASRTLTLRLICDGTQRTLTVPAGWVFVGTKPANIAASKTAILSLTFFGTADSDCIAAYGVQS